MTDTIPTQLTQERDYIESLSTMRGILHGVALAAPLWIGGGVTLFLLVR
jgi:hypothetical protein